MGNAFRPPQAASLREAKFREWGDGCGPCFAPLDHRRDQADHTFTEQRLHLRRWHDGQMFDEAQLPCAAAHRAIFSPNYHVLCLRTRIDSGNRFVRKWTLDELQVDPSIVENDLARPFNANPHWTITSVLQRLKHAGIGCYVVGGAVRNWLEAKPARDLDIAVTTPIEEALIALEDITSTADHMLNAQFGLIYLLGDIERVDISILRSCDDIDGEIDNVVFRGGNSLAQDAHARDFTINAFYYCPSTQFVYNPYPDALRDLRAKELNLIMDERKLEVDYLVCIRILQFLARGYTASSRILKILAQRLDGDILRYDQFGPWMKNYVPKDRLYYGDFKKLMYEHSSHAESRQRLDRWFSQIEA